eukprot:scaffold79117_cov16-Tisochrysis_lutea.AAC.1
MQYGVSLIMLDNEGEVASRLWGTRSPRESIFSFEKLTECYQNQAASSQLLTSAVRVYWLVSASGASTKKMRVEGGGGGNNQKTGKKSHIGSTTTPYFDYYSCQVIAWVMLPLAPSSPYIVYDVLALSLADAPGFLVVAVHTFVHILGIRLGSVGQG